MHHTVEIENLSYAYPDGHRALADITLHIGPDEKVALVGASGGGKSTLVQALLGLYPVKSGQILYGGVPVTEIGWETVREHVGVRSRLHAHRHGRLRSRR